MVDTDAERLAAAIDAIEAQRAILGDDATDIALAPLQQQLDALATTAGSGRIRHVTILFTDVVGSTTIGQQLDPEDFNELMDSAMRRFTTIVEAVDGQVLKYMGDGMLAAFGTRVAQESDAEHAVIAGLGIVDAARRVRVERAAELGVGFDVRIGIDSGTVIVGGSVEGDSAIRGHAVNLAARMEQSAPVGGLRISHATHQLVRGLFESIEDPATVVKGVAEPLRTHLVIRRAPRAQRHGTRGVEGIASPMIARDAEFAALQTLFARVEVDRRLGAVSISAEPGVGKSRLMEEFAGWLRARREPPAMLTARASSHTTRQPYGLLAAVLWWRCGIDDTDSADSARAKLVDALRPLFGADDASVHLLGHLVGLDFGDSTHIRGILGDPAQLRDRGLAAFAEMCARLAARGPLVLLLDDLHWADSASLDALEQLVAERADLPVMLVAASRPELRERRPNWWGDDGALDLQLQPLDPGSAGDLAAALLARVESVPDELRRAMERADGNPYFMEEIVRMLLDEGVLRDAGDGTWHVTADVGRLHVPGTLQAVLQSRVDRLRAVERTALQQASVIGYHFWDRAIAALEPRSVPALGPLQARGFVERREESSIADATELTFRHHLLHQFAYDTLPKRERREYHARAARWLEDLTAATGIDAPAVIGDHFERAGLIGEAVDCFARGAEVALTRGAMGSAVELADHGLTLVTSDDAERRWRLLATIESASYRADDHARRGDVVAELDALAERLDDDERRADAAMRRLSLWQRAGELQRVADASDIYELCERTGAGGAYARTLNLRSTALRQLGRLADARRTSEEALVRVRDVGDQLLESAVLAGYSCVLNEQGDVGAARVAALGAVAISVDLHDEYGIADGLVCASAVAFGCGDYPAAIAEAAEGYRVALACGWRFVQSTAQLNLAWALLRDGQTDAAIAAAVDALRIAEAIGIPDVAAACLLAEGIAHAEAGEWLPARQALAAAHDTNRELGVPHGAIEAVAWLAELDRRDGDLDAAVAGADEVLRFIADECADAAIDGIFEPLHPQLICWRILVEAGDARADQVLADAATALDRLAGLITDLDIRRSFLERIPHHRAILSAARPPT